MRAAALALAAALAGGPACVPRDAPAAAGREDLLAVAEPPALDQLDAPIVEQYRERRAAVDRALSEAGTPDAALGQAFGDLGLWGVVYRFPGTAEPALINAERLSGAAGWHWSYYLAHFYRRRGDNDAARHAFLRVLERRPADVPTLVWLGEIELAAGRPEQARQRFSEALGHDPRCARARAGLGRVALLAGDAEAALRQLSTALELAPDEPEIHYALGLAYRDLGDVPQAEEHLRLGVGEGGRGRRPIPMRDPLNAALHALDAGADQLVRRAREALRSGRVEEGVELYRQAVAAAPETTTVRIGYGNALLRAGRPEQALREYAEVLRLDPGNASALFNSGLLHEGAGRFEQAERLYREALESDPRHARAQLRLGVMLARRGRPDAALERFEAAVRGEPAAEEPRLRRAATLLALGRRADAVEALESDLQALPAGARLRSLLARVLATGDRARATSDRALALAREGFAGDPTVFGAETMAMVLAARGSFAEARAWQEAARRAVQAAGADDSDLQRIRRRGETYARGAACAVPLDAAEPLVGTPTVEPPAEAGNGSG